MAGNDSDLFPDPYRKVRQIGQGTFGAVWLVTNGRNSKCVIKRIPLFEYPTEEQQRAEREAQLLRQLTHPNIVTFEDSFVHGGALNIVMEYCPAGDLHQLIDRHARAQQPLAEERIYQWLVQMVRALAHIHAHSIVHRDFKPANVLLASGTQLKVADFGISKLMSATSQVAHTVIGTPAYFAPELCDNDPYDGKCDMWSLGVVLYELCALRLPFPGSNILALVRQITTEEPPPLPSQYQSRAFPLFVSLLLQKVAACRPSAQEFLERYIETGVFTATDPANGRPKACPARPDVARPPRRNSKPPVILCPPGMEAAFRDAAPAASGRGPNPPPGGPAAAKVPGAGGSRKRGSRAKGRRAAGPPPEAPPKGYAAQFRQRQAQQAKANGRTPHCRLDRFLVRPCPDSPSRSGKERQERSQTPKKAARPLQPPELQGTPSSRSLLQSKPDIHHRSRKSRKATPPKRPPPAPPCFAGLDPQLSAALEHCGDPLHRSMCVDNALFHSPLLREAAGAPVLVRCDSSPVLPAASSPSQSSLEYTTNEEGSVEEAETRSSHPAFAHAANGDGPRPSVDAARAYEPHRLADALWAAGERRERAGPPAAAGAKAAKAARPKAAVPRPPAGLPSQKARPGGPGGVGAPTPRSSSQPPPVRSPRAARRGRHGSPRSPTASRPPPAGPPPPAPGIACEPPTFKPAVDVASPRRSKRRASSAKRPTKEAQVPGPGSKASEATPSSTARQRTPQPPKPAPSSTAFLRKLRSVKPTIDRNSLRRLHSEGGGGAGGADDAIVIGCVYLPRKLLDEAPRPLS